MAPRNHSGVRFERIRARFDPVICELQDKLEVAYYQHWRQGLAHTITLTDADGASLS